MTWGFFLYVIWFNPGQSAQYYALLQLYSPIALLTQNLVGAIAQGAGLAGFIWFALRAPTDETTSRWRPVERSLPVVALLLMLLLVVSYANLLGYRTEMLTRAGVISGLVVAMCGLGIFLARRRELPPQDYQRLRWVIWGCLIGLLHLSLRMPVQPRRFLTFYGLVIPRPNNYGVCFTSSTECFAFSLARLCANLTS